MTEGETFAKVTEALVEALGVDDDEVTLEAKISADLGAESIDFLRIREHGYPIVGVVWDNQTVGVDRPDDISAVERALAEDVLQRALHERITS